MPEVWLVATTPPGASKKSSSGAGGARERRRVACYLAEPREHGANAAAAVTAACLLVSFAPEGRGNRHRWGRRDPARLLAMVAGLIFAGCDSIATAIRMLLRGGGADLLRCQGGSVYQRSCCQRFCS